MRPCKESEITIERLMNVVHNYTDPIRIRVVMGNAWLTYDEARHMRDFYLTKCYSYTDGEKGLGLLIAMMGAALGEAQTRQYGVKMDTSAKNILKDEGVRYLLELD